MANRYFLILLYTLVLIPSIKAISNNSKKTKRYYLYIQKAESNILIEDFTSAVRNYKKAFKYLEHPFSNDLYVASICMLKTKISINDLKNWNKLHTYQTNKTLRERLVNFDIKYYNKLSEEEWINIISDTVILSDYALMIREKLNILVNKDQAIRLQMEELYGVNKYYLSEPRDKIKKIDSLNLYELSTIVSDDFFNAYEIGSEGWDNLYLIVLHNSQWYKLFPMAEKLKYLVKEGKLDNRLFAYLIGRFCENTDQSFRERFCIRGDIYGEKLYWVYGDYNTYPHYNKNEIKNIDRNRQDIYLNSIEERIKQLIYQEKKENLFFIKENVISSLSEHFLKEIESSIDSGSLKLIE